MSDTDKAIESLSPKKRELFELLLKEQQDKSAAPAQTIPRRPSSGSHPLSFAQQRLWFIDLLEPGTPAYNMPFAWRLKGALNIGALERALSEIVARHEVLRARFPTVDNRPVQIISAPERVSLPVVDLSRLSEPERMAQAAALASEEARRSFDLSTGPLFRVKLLRLGEDDQAVLLTMHHIVTDGWSLGVLLKEMSALYAAFAAGQPLSLPDLPIQYADFAEWQAQRLQGEAFEKLLSYWKERLAGAPPALELPADRPRPATPSFRGATRHFTIAQDLYESLDSLSRNEGVTLFMTLLAAFQTLLCRYTGQDDIVVGTPIANRNHAELEGLIGFFVNTLVLRADLSDNPAFRQSLKRVREVALEAYGRQDMPFEKLVEELRPDRDLSRTPVFQIMFHLQNTPLASLDLPGLSRADFPAPESATAMFDLSLSMIERPDAVAGGEGRLEGSIEYNTDLFDECAIDRLIGHFQSLLESVAANPDLRLAQIPLLTAAERHRILVEWNETRTDYPAACLHQMFEEQARRTPQATAVVCGDERLSYGELNALANKLAHYLREAGVGPETPAGICLERSADLIVAMLGVLKAGGAYVPLDPAYPKERLALILEDARAKITLTRQRLNERVRGHASRIVEIDSERGAISAKSAEDPISAVSPENSAYVIYTSGSTGRPKGVVVTHKNLVNHAFAIRQRYGLEPDDRALQFASISFDVAAEEIFPTLLSGAAVVFRSDDAVSGEDFLNFVEERRVSVLNLPATYWHELVDGLAHSGKQLLSAVRLMIVGSEKVSTGKLAVWQSLEGRRIPCINAYGLTETTITTTLHEPAAVIDPLSRRAHLPIGRPIAGARIYILDSLLEPVPVGVAGELYIGGEGLARGYLDRPDLTAEKFIPNPFSAEPGARLYRTGDLARYRPDAEIELLGRADNQIKLRGFRIEPGEIEATLSLHPAVRESLVMLREDKPGQPLLTGYAALDPDRSATASELRSFLTERLPDYMIPAAFVLMDALPLGPQGKIDRRALPAPDKRQKELEDSYVTPRTDMERTISVVWQEALGVERVGMNDNFFDLGGHSLLMAEIFAKLQKVVDKPVTMVEMFEYPTVSSLARHLTKEKPERSSGQIRQEMSEKLKDGKSRLRQQFRQRHLANKKR